ncbi:hypothetical protein SAMN05192580_1077 [Sphingomonas jatrophae]|uniref:Uncharacterized protein n=1 Tax=Sphingomonas jatrophae TaxID=1166337 RepID=A0A1I6JYE5_9SPHN|nr:hypothetical protein SAMN05192580_1077 [Sphingomonas jatrophae]
MPAPTQPDQAEGERNDEPRPDKGSNQGVSTEEPAEGGDDVPAGAAGAPRG